MHIAVVTRNMCAGGAERVISQLLKCWVKQNVECSLISIEPAKMFYEMPNQVGVIDIPKFSQNRYIEKYKKYKELRNVLTRIRPDVVLALPEEIGVYVMLAMLGTKIPIVVSERNNPWVMPDKKETRLLRRIMYPFVKGLIFQTRQAASFFPKSQQNKGIVLPNPLDCSRLPAVYEGKKEKTVVGAGRLEKQKNFPLLIEAFAMFQKIHPDYKLVIYGEGNERSALEEMAEELLIPGTWQFPGRVKDLPERISRCEVFALSSDYEGVPNVLIEAMAVGTTVVSTDCAPGGAASLIENGVNGLLVPIGNVQKLSEALIGVVDTPSDAKRMAKEAVNIREVMNAEIIAQRWKEYLEKCCS